MKKRVELSFRGEDLENLQYDPISIFSSKSSPVLEVFLKEDRDFEKIGTTEKILSNLSPKWKFTIKLTFFSERAQTFKFVVRDRGSGYWGRLIGEATCPFSSICDATDMIHPVELRKSKEGKVTGKLVVTAEEIPGGFDMGDKFLGMTPEEKLKAMQGISMDQFFEHQTYVFFQLNGVKLKKMDLFGKVFIPVLFYQKILNETGKSDPFYKIFRSRGVDDWREIMKSEMIKNTLNPEWEFRKIHFNDFCSGDVTKKVRIEVFDWNTNEPDQLIGEVIFTVKDVVDHPDQLLELRMPKKNKKKSKQKKVRGRLQFKKFVIKSEEGYNQEKIKMWKEERQKLIVEVERRRAIAEQERFIPAFINFLHKYEISLAVGIDFSDPTGERVLPNDPKCIHHLSPDKIPNEFQRALKEIAPMILQYDKDRSIPFFGMNGIPVGRDGDKLLPDLHYLNKNVFPMNRSDLTPEVRGLEGLLETYEKALKTVVLGTSGRYLSSMISKVQSMVSESVRVNPRKYHVVLLLMSGDNVDDCRYTLNKLSELPVSLIIVGLGESRFVKMIVLDEHMEGSEKRDVVQFVPYRKFQGTDDLANQVLQELPQHVVEYERKNNGILFTEDEVKMMIRNETKELKQKVEEMQKRLLQLEKLVMEGKVMEKE